MPDFLKMDQMVIVRIQDKVIEPIGSYYAKTMVVLENDGGQRFRIHTFSKRKCNNIVVLAGSCYELGDTVHFGLKIFPKPEYTDSEEKSPEEMLRDAHAFLIAERESPQGNHSLPKPIWYAGRLYGMINYRPKSAFQSVSPRGFRKCNCNSDGYNLI